MSILTSRVLENAPKSLSRYDEASVLRACRQRGDELVAETLVVSLCRSQNTDAKLLIYQLFQEGRVLAQDALDSESDDPIESGSSMLETVVGRAFRRRERLSALAAPVSTAFP